MSKVLIIGGGAAGMFASIFAGRSGNEVHLFEQNDKLGKKLFITGKGRCNLTNASDMEQLFQSVVSNSKFLYSAFYGFTNDDVVRFFEESGLKTKVERGNRVFPQSDHSSDVIKILQQEMKKAGVHIHLNTRVKGLLIDKGEQAFVCGIRLFDGTVEEGDKVIVCTGGCSYESTGSTGDGYHFAKEAGLKVTETYPALVPLVISEPCAGELMGLSLRNVNARILKGNKLLYEDFGEMLFTHYGVSGPVMLTASSFIGPALKKGPLTLLLDLKPALTKEQLDKRILRDFSENLNRQYKNALGKLFPSKLIPVMIERSGISPEKKVNEITKQERMQLVELCKAFPLTITGLRSFAEAIITKGGVSVKEINPATMESKKVKGLYFAGEVLDLDAVTGGYNLQIAWSTAHAAGNNIE